MIFRSRTRISCRDIFSQRYIGEIIVNRLYSHILSIQTPVRIPVFLSINSLIYTGAYICRNELWYLTNVADITSSLLHIFDYGSTYIIMRAAFGLVGLVYNLQNTNGIPSRIGVFG